MKEYHLVTDTYRLFSTLNKMCNRPLWYNSGPSQKFILRQIKAMDHSAIGVLVAQGRHADRASPTSNDGDDDMVPADQLDVGLLMLYGQVLYAGTSYAYALSEFIPSVAPSAHR